MVVSCSNYGRIPVHLKELISISLTGVKSSSWVIFAVDRSSVFEVNTCSKWLYFDMWCKETESSGMFICMLHELWTRNPKFVSGPYLSHAACSNYRVLEKSSYQRPGYLKQNFFWPLSGHCKYSTNTEYFVNYSTLNHKNCFSCHISDAFR